MRAVYEFLQRLRASAAVLVSVAGAAGSTPREVGAWMAVFNDGQIGTIGGGQLERRAIAEARDQLHAGTSSSAVRRYALGPSLGQCCGGVMQLRFETVDATKIEAITKALTRGMTCFTLFGAGHVAQAIVRLMADLPFDVTWIDSRDDVFPRDTPQHIRCEHSAPVERAVAQLRPDSHVLIMSFSHAEDLEIVAACLLRQRQRADLPYIGLIGSKTKWATFQHRLAARGFAPHELALVHCPIGLPDLPGKQPAVVALSVVADLLRRSAAT